MDDIAHYQEKYSFKPHKSFFVIWSIIFFFPLLFFIIVPTYFNLTIDDSTFSDNYMFKEKLDLEVPISKNIPWTVLFSIGEFPHNYRLRPNIYVFGNWSESTSIGAFKNNFSIYINNELIHECGIWITVPHEPDAWAAYWGVLPGIEEWKTKDFSSPLHSGLNNLTVNNYLYSEIEQPGKANMVLEIGPVVLYIKGPHLPGINAYILTIISGILLLPIAEIIRGYGKRIIKN